MTNIKKKYICISQNTHTTHGKSIYYSIGFIVFEFLYTYNLLKKLF